MKTLNEIKEILTLHKTDLASNYNVKEIGVFGSYSTGNQRKSSDIDILVQFDKAISLLKFLELEEYLSSLLGLKVDLVTKESLKPYIGEYVLKDVVYL